MAFISDEDLLEEFEIVEDKAEKALKKIQSLYKDIMGVSDTDGDSKGYEFAESDVKEKDLSVLKSELDERYVSIPKVKSKKTGGGGKNELCEKYQRIEPSVLRAKQTQQHPAENYWSHFQNGCIFPESGYQNPTEHNNYYIPKSSNRTVQKTDSDGEHYCPLKITVPEPFQMTLREMQQKDTKELAKQKLKEKWSKSVENELRKKIHARPVPGHIHLPLYQKIVETYEQKKVRRKQQTSQRLKDLVKPFNLSQKSDHKFLRSESMPDLTSPKVVNPKFKAKPVPQSILSSHVTENLKEKEEKRKIRIAERSRELLKSSSLPFSEKKPLRKSSSTGSLNQENVSSAKKSASYGLKSKPKQGLSRLEQKEIFEQWNNRVASVNHRGVSSKDDVIESSLNKSKDFLVSQALPFYDLPVKMTTSAMLREKQNRKTLNTRRRNEEQKFDEEVKRIETEKQLKKVLGPKLKEADPTLDMKKQIEEQLKSYRESRLLRQQEYEKELEEMKLRVQKQPLLVARQSQVGKKTVTTFDPNIEISSNEDVMSKSSEVQSDDTDKNSSSSLES